MARGGEGQQSPTQTLRVGEVGDVHLTSEDAHRATGSVAAWWVCAGSLAFPLADRTVGERRAIPDDRDRHRPTHGPGPGPGSRGTLRAERALRPR